MYYEEKELCIGGKSDYSKQYSDQPEFEQHQASEMFFFPKLEVLFFLPWVPIAPP